MKNVFNKTTFLASVLAMAMQPVFAADKSDTVSDNASSKEHSTKISGEMIIDVKAGDVTSVALGSDNISDVKIGTIGGSDLKDVEIKVDVQDVTSVALGSDNKSIVSIGSIENSKIGGSAKINVKAGDITSVALGSDNTSSVRMGSVY